MCLAPLGVASVAVGLGGLMVLLECGGDLVCWC